MTSGARDDPAPSDRPPKTRVDDAIAVHREHMERVADHGDPAQVKRSYVELGDLLDTAVGSDVEASPVLSYKENADAIAALSATMRGRILDAGCGPYPIHTMRLRDVGGRTLVALDIGFGMVRLATDVAEREGVRVLGVVGDLEALPFRDGVFDGCICADAIEHVPDDVSATAELARVLRPDGLLILATPNRTRLDATKRRVLDRLQGVKRDEREYFETTSHLREYTWRDLRSLVDQRFAIRGWASVGYSGGYRARAYSQLMRTRPLRWLSKMVVYTLEPKRSANRSA